MREDEWGEGPETVDVCVEDFANLPRASGPPGALLLVLFAEGLALVAIGASALVVR